MTPGGSRELDWNDLADADKDELAVFLLAVNSEIAFVDGRMTKREAEVDPIFQVILARSRGDLVRQALFHLSERFDSLGRRLAIGFVPGQTDFVGGRIGRVREILGTVRADEMRRYLTAVFYVGLATAEADGSRFGSKVSPQERDRLDSILLALGLGFAGSEDVLRSWLKSG